MKISIFLVKWLQIMQKSIGQVVMMQIFSVPFVQTESFTIIYKEKKNHFLVKMAANYANIYRVGGLDAGFEQVPLVQTETLTIIYKEKTKLFILLLVKNGCKLCKNLLFKRKVLQ